MARKATTKTDSTAALGFEAKLWLAADDLRNNMDAAVTERSDKRRLQSTCVVRLLTEIIEPYHGRILDPACGSGGMNMLAA
jgi:type I restriction-modification system DNA methylase subunit